MAREARVLTTVARYLVFIETEALLTGSLLIDEEWLFMRAATKESTKAEAISRDVYVGVIT